MYIRQEECKRASKCTCTRTCAYRYHTAYACTRVLLLLLLCEFDVCIYDYNTIRIAGIEGKQESTAAASARPNSRQKKIQRRKAV